MMNSLSENSRGDAGAWVSLPDFPVRTPKRGPLKKEIARLEFEAVGQDGSQMEVLEIETDPRDQEKHLQEEEAALAGRLESQAQEIEARIEEERAKARLIAREEWQAELDERVTTERTVMQRMSQQFGKEQARYFAGVEAEVVKLSLAIAARILHREAKMDPLLLVATVRVALEKVAEEGGMMMRVPVVDLEMWRGVFEPDGDISLKLTGDERLSAGECVLETKVGTVELGVSAQLAEIERGFFDLLQQRPS
jgi:flagellar assembly protein FliH